MYLFEICPQLVFQFFSKLRFFTAQIVLFRKVVFQIV